MPTPRTELDDRFSHPDSTAVGWDETQELIGSAQLFWITTVRADGRPHVTPLVAVWLDDALHFCTGAEEQKQLNLQTNPNVVLTTGCNEWNVGVDVMVEGSAHRVTDTETLGRLAAAWATKWDGSWRFEANGDMFRGDDGSEALVYAVRPTKVLTFGKDPYSHTRHVF